MQPSECSSELNVPPGKKRKKVNVPPGKKRKKVKLDYEESTKKRKKCSSKSKLNVPPGKKRKKVNNIFENEEIEIVQIQTYYEEYNKSNSDNIQEKPQQVKSLRVICKEKLDSISRSKRIYVKTCLPVKNTIRYTEYYRKSALEKLKFLKQNSTEVMSEYKCQFEKGKKLKQNEANHAQITQYSNPTLAYDIWKSTLIKSLKPKKVEPPFNPKKVQPPIQLQQIEIDKIEENDKMPQHKSTNAREGIPCECKSSEDKMNHIQLFANTELRKEKKLDKNGLLPNDYFNGKVRNER